MPKVNLEEVKEKAKHVRTIVSDEVDDIIPAGVVRKDLLSILKRGASSSSEVRLLYEQYTNMQRERIRLSNRVKSLKKEKIPTLILEYYLEEFRAMETNMARVLEKWVKYDPVYEQWLSKIRGIGGILAAGLVSYVRPEHCRTAGSVWRYAGIDVGPHDPLATNAYSRHFKHVCWLTAQSLVRAKPKAEGQENLYYDLYLLRKMYEIQKNERLEYADQAQIALKRYNFGKNTIAYKCYSAGKLPPAHINSRAMRWMIKIFLSHLAHVTYEIHTGNPPPAPYIIAIKGHKDYIAPPYFESKADWYKALKERGTVFELPAYDASKIPSEYANDEEFEDEEALA